MTNEINIFDIPVHPAADAFPMMEEEELEELAADIKANGLQQPLVIDVLLDQDELNGPVLIDGRNRREACRRVGVIPDYTLLDGQDPVTYILSVNINRRHMTKGQRATVTARLKPETTMGRNSDVKELATNLGVSSEYLRKARFVLRYASDLGDPVIKGSISLENAYEEARIRKGRAETHEARFERLKAAAPDLAEMVIEERLGLEEAQVALDERLSRIRRATLPFSMVRKKSKVYPSRILAPWG